MTTINNVLPYGIELISDVKELTKRILNAMASENKTSHGFAGTYFTSSERHRRSVAVPIQTQRDGNTFESYPLVNTAAYLSDFLSYDYSVNKFFHDFIESNEDSLDGLELCAMDIPAIIEFMREEQGIDIELVMNMNYTYNFETPFMQDFQFANFTYNGKQYFAIEFHIGVDVRAGFSQTHIFEFDTSWNETYQLIAPFMSGVFEVNDEPVLYSDDSDGLIDIDSIHSELEKVGIVFDSEAGSYFVCDKTDSPLELKHTTDGCLNLVDSEGTVLASLHYSYIV